MRTLSMLLSLALAFALNTQPVSAAAAAAAIPKLVSASAAGIPLKAPKGWTVQVDTGQGLITLRGGTATTSPTIVLALTQNAAANVTAPMLVKNALATTGAAVKVTGTETVANGQDLFVEASLSARGLTLSSAVMGYVDGRTRAAFVGMFLALPADYAKLGGAPLLVAVASSVGQKPVTANRRPSPSPGRSGLKPLQGAAVTAKALVGDWSHVGIGAMVERVDIHGQTVGNDHIGKGLSYTFDAKGRYSLTYLNESRNGYCYSRHRATETGRYTFKGAKLTLKPKKVAGDICNCSCKRPRKYAKKGKKLLPSRTYETFFAAHKNAFVLRGYCAGWMTHGSCNTIDNLTRKGGKASPDLLHDTTWGRTAKPAPKKRKVSAP